MSWYDNLKDSMKFSRSQNKQTRASKQTKNYENPFDLPRGQPTISLVKPSSKKSSTKASTQSTHLRGGYGPKASLPKVAKSSIKDVPHKYVGGNKEESEKVSSVVKKTASSFKGGPKQYSQIETENMKSVEPKQSATTKAEIKASKEGSFSYSGMSKAYSDEQKRKKTRESNALEVNRQRNTYPGVPSWWNAGRGGRGISSTNTISVSTSGQGIFKEKTGWVEGKDGKPKKVKYYVE